MNWGSVGGYAGAVLAAFSAIGYAFAGDTRRALYFSFACAITLTMVWR